MTLKPRSGSVCHGNDRFQLQTPGQRPGGPKSDFLSADRFGGKSVFLAAYSCFFLTAVLSLFVTSVAGFLLVFLLFGMGFTMRVVGQQTLTLEIAPLERLPTYFALALSGTAPFMLLAAGIAVVAGGYAERIDAFWPLAVPSALATLAAMLLMLRVKEPRNDQAPDSERTPVALE